MSSRRISKSLETISRVNLSTWKQLRQSQSNFHLLDVSKPWFLHIQSAEQGYRLHEQRRSHCRHWVGLYPKYTLDRMTIVSHDQCELLVSVLRQRAESTIFQWLPYHCDRVPLVLCSCPVSSRSQRLIEGHAGLDHLVLANALRAQRPIKGDRLGLLELDQGHRVAG